LPSAFRRLVYLTPFATEKEKFFSLVWLVFFVNPKIFQ
jgi:hypothetical protein